MAGDATTNRNHKVHFHTEAEHQGSHLFWRSREGWPQRCIIELVTFTFSSFKVAVFDFGMVVIHATKYFNSSLLNVCKTWRENVANRVLHEVFWIGASAMEDIIPCLPILFSWTWSMAFAMVSFHLTFLWSWGFLLYSYSCIWFLIR